MVCILLRACEIWSPTIREKQRLGMSENMVLRKLSSTKESEVRMGVEKTAK
jgi:hypothetical protein